MEEASFELQIAIKRQVKNIMTESTVSKEIGLSRVKLPKVSVSTLNGSLKFEALVGAI